MSLSRRKFGAIVAGTLSAGTTLSPAPLSAMKSNPSRLRITAQFHPEDTTGMVLAREHRVDDLAIWTTLTEENLTKKVARATSEGMHVTSASRMSDWWPIVLNLPGREAAIEQFNRETIALGKVGIRQRNITFYATGVTITHQVPARGGQLTRAYDPNRPRDPELSYAYYKLDLDRTYQPEGIWDNYTHFIKRAAPVAEDANVRIAIHPEDPPGQTFGGEPRVIASSFDGYKRAFEIADSPNVGMCLCTGCWLEGGEIMGKDIIETIKYFGARNKIFKVHFRNVSSTLPVFHETWPDDGYYDMYLIMRALREVNNDCIITADHWPGRKTEDGVYTGWSHCAAYMNALLERANDEVG
jgi:mannonate dehydratase